MTEDKLVEIVSSGDPERIESSKEPIVVGQWYWVTPESKKSEWLACVVLVGSNFAKLKSPQDKTQRIHFDDFDRLTRRELDPKAVIEGRVKGLQSVVSGLMEDVKAITARLGVGPAVETSASTALAVLSGAPDVKEYESALVKAQKEELPDLFQRIKETNENLAEWMTAELLPLKALANSMESVVEDIEGRIFNVSLYAGLTEQVTRIKKGEPAPADSKLHVMQRRLYADEECLLNYRHGGMDFDDIKDFDKWLTKKENLNRVLPFPRCLVAMRVRRDEKERDWEGDLQKLWVKIQLEELDKLTFLYFRNGDRVYRMNCDLEFGELIFPAMNEFTTEPLVAKVDSYDKPKEFRPVREHEALVAKEAEREKNEQAWLKANPFKKWKKKVYDPEHTDRSDFFARSAYERANPFFGGYGIKDNLADWVPFDKTSVYYDECLKDRASAVLKWNRIALIIQGLFDRSEVFHPHPPVMSWTPVGFAAAIELVYDGSNTLYNGEPPDFEEYRKRGLESLDVGSITIGQDRIWHIQVREVEGNRRLRDHRLSHNHKEVGSWWRPHGDAGPGYLAKVAEWNPKKRVATFLWLKNKRNATWRSEKKLVQGKIEVPATDLFNVSSYKPGDHKIFFLDPRTRERYLRWAPMLLAAEEYYAGNLKAQEPNAEAKEDCL
jgi:hypothetical protein